MKKTDSEFDLSEFKLDPRDQEIADFNSKIVNTHLPNFEIYYKDKLLARVNYQNSIGVTVEQFTDHPFYRQFKNPNPLYQDVRNWLNNRCFPKYRYNRRQLMYDLGIGAYQHSMFEYMLILKQTHGMILEDYIWIKFEGEDICYDDIKIRD